MENSEALYEAGTYVKVEGTNVIYQVICYRSETYYFLDDVTHDVHSYDLLSVNSGVIVNFPEEKLVCSIPKPDEFQFEVTDIKVDEYIEQIVEDTLDDFDDPYALYDGYGEDLMKYYEDDLRQLVSDSKGENGMNNGEKKLTPREQSAVEAENRKKDRQAKAEKTDSLLDTLYNLLSLREEFGDNDASKYGERIEAIKRELSELNSK